MDLQRVTIQDCIDLYEKKERVVILNDGKVINIISE